MIKMMMMMSKSTSNIFFIVFKLGFCFKKYGWRLNVNIDDIYYNMEWYINDIDDIEMEIHLNKTFIFPTLYFPFFNKIRNIAYQNSFSIPLLLPLFSSRSDQVVS